MKSLGGMTRPKDEMGSQNVSSEPDISHPIRVYLSWNNNSKAQARRFPSLTAPEPVCVTFTIVRHSTSSFTYVSVIYGANFPFKLEGSCYPAQQ